MRGVGTEGERDRRKEELRRERDSLGRGQGPSGSVWDGGRDRVGQSGKGAGTR